MHYSVHDTLRNICQIYHYFCQDQEIISHLYKFRQWPMVFIPRLADYGEFVFAHEVFWDDPESLLFGISFNHQRMQPVSLKQIYGSVPQLELLFINVLQVKRQPNLEDYLFLLDYLTDKNLEYIWRCIQVIVRLALKENKQQIVKGLQISSCHR